MFYLIIKLGILICFLKYCSIMFYFYFFGRNKNSPPMKSFKLLEKNSIFRNGRVNYTEMRRRNTGE